MKKSIDFNDDNLIKYLEQHIKDEIEKEYNLSYDELTSLDEIEQDKLINNASKNKRKSLFKRKKFHN